MFVNKPTKKLWGFQHPVSPESVLFQNPRLAQLPTNRTSELQSPARLCYETLHNLRKKQTCHKSKYLKKQNFVCLDVFDTKNSFCWDVFGSKPALKKASLSGSDHLHESTHLLPESSSSPATNEYRLRSKPSSKKPKGRKNTLPSKLVLSLLEKC